MMKTRPIIFNGRMVNAILNDIKIQTRRVIKPQFNEIWGFGVQIGSDYFSVHVDIKTRNGWRWINCPYGKPGDKLWVRETWKNLPDGGIGYRASPDETCRVGNFILIANWKPSIHMPRWASRIMLEIENIKVERLQEISESDAALEGVPGIATHKPYPRQYRDSFEVLWDSINAKRGYPWESNPWVWVIQFKKERE